MDLAAGLGERTGMCSCVGEVLGIGGRAVSWAED